jgi:integrase
VVNFPIEEQGQWQRGKKYFKTKTQATEFEAAMKRNLANHGAKQAAISEDERNAVIRFRLWSERQSNPIDLITLINEAIEQREKAEVTATVREIVDDRITQAQRKNSSKRHIEDLESRLSRFAATFGDRNAGSIQAREIEVWIYQQTSHPVTFGNYLRTIGGAFALALKQGKINVNPNTMVDRPKVKLAPPSILRPEQLSALLQAASEAVRPLLVLQAFAGVRRAEAERMRWDLVRLNSSEPSIDLPSEITKTSHRRSVNLPGNAVQWLKPLAKAQGPLSSLTAHQYRKELEAASKVAGITWSENLLRHSFGSYRVAQMKNVPLVAEEMGNSPNVVRTHYHNLVRQEDVSGYWSITPSHMKQNVVNMPKTKARKAVG